nr:uncharacterized protein LOC109190975 isoform X1 [Ipomoea trifida]
MGIPVALRLHCLKEIHRLFPLNHAGKSYQLLGGAGSLVPLCLSSSLQKSIGSIGKYDYKSCDYRRYSTISKSKQESLPQHDLLSFIQSTINKHEGPSHCWLNGIALKKNFFKKEGITLVIVAEFFQGSSLSQHDLFIMLDKVKLLQQRYPFLPVMGYQYSTSPLLSKDDHTHLLRRVMKEYITFPILLSNKNFPKITGGTCCIIFRGLMSPIIYQGKEVDSMILDNGCISVDEKGNRVFVSDSNHHRIIVFDANGEILDSIGSSPGFEDGDFENAKLMRPAASFYHAADNCLYIADSENHAIRRADMGRRILDTLYPAMNSNKDSNRLWSWIFGKLWSRKDIEAKSDEFPPKTLLFPWHISKCQNDLFVLNRKGSPRNCGRYGSHCQGTSLLVACYYIINYFLYTEGFSNISEICGHLILEKSNILKQIPNDLLKQLMHTDCSLEGIPYAGLISSIATFQDDLIICNTVGQEVLKFNFKSATLSTFQFSNFSILGLPYWFSFPLERVCATKDVLSGLHVDHAELFNLLPGKVDIKLSIEIPKSFELVEPLIESCIWLQARGAATVVSEAERISTSEKVCAAQQWYDELDHRTFWESELESNKEVHSSTESSVEVLSSSHSEVVPEGKVLIDCSINTSPGTSEVIISAALYLKLRKTADTSMDSREQKAAKMADSLDPTRRVSKDLLVSFLLASKRDLEGLIVTRPLQVRLKFECPNHPTSEDNSKEIIITNSSINVSVSLLNP